MRYSAFVFVFGLFTAAAFGQQAKPNFSGNWRLIPDKSEIQAGRSTVVGMAIEQKEASIHIARTIKDVDGKESTVEFTCQTDGSDCDGPGFKVSLFYDGRALVEMDFSDTVVSRTTMTLDDSRTICASIVYLVPKGEGDTLTFDKK